MQMVAGVRQVFAVILEFEVVTDPMGLWLKHKEQMCEDFKRRAEARHGVTIDIASVENECLLELHHLLAHLARTWRTLGCRPWILRAWTPRARLARWRRS